MKSLLLLLLATVAIQATEDESDEYAARAWELRFYGGEYRDFKEDVPYLMNYDFDNEISSLNVTGVWILYGEPEYNTYKPSYVYWVWGIDREESLENDNVNDKISSLRFASRQSHFNEDGYNLYEGELFTKKHLYGTSDIPDLSLFHQDVKSVIIIGESSWYACEEAYFNGRCVCLSSNLYDKKGVTWRLEVGFHGSISEYDMDNVMSIRKGCVWTRNNAF